MLRMAFAILPLLLLVLACADTGQATKSNFEEILNSYYQKNPECAYSGNRFPFQLYFNGSKKRELLFEAWVERGLLRREHQEGKADRWTLTDKGKPYYSNVDSCANVGFREVLSVDNFTVPSDAMGVTISQVNYTYTVKEIPDWAEDEAAITYFGKKLPKSGVRIADQVVLVQTANGWVHEREMSNQTRIQQTR